MQLISSIHEFDDYYRTTAVQGAHLLRCYPYHAPSEAHTHNLSSA